MSDIKIDRRPRSRRNRYGDYYFVTGEARDGSECVYAWQLMRDGRTALPENVKDVAVQLRFCSANRKAEDIVKLFDEVTLIL